MFKRIALFVITNLAIVLVLCKRGYYGGVPG